MCLFNTGLSVLIIFVTCAGIPSDVEGSLMSMVDFRYWRCVMKREWKCPDSEINFFLYTPEWPHPRWIDVRHRDLSDFGWKVTRRNVLIIHGFNGTHSKTPMSFLRDAYLSRKDYNVFMVDWSRLSRFPCYLSALSNMRLAAQCTAQLYSFMTQAGALAKMTTCVGHSLGAHVCGMMSEHLTQKQYKIVGDKMMRRTGRVPDGKRHTYPFKSATQILLGPALRSSSWDLRCYISMSSIYAGIITFASEHSNVYTLVLGGRITDNAVVPLQTDSA